LQSIQKKQLNSWLFSGKIRIPRCNTKGTTEYFTFGI